MINVETDRLREPAAWLMVAVASAGVLVGIERLLFRGSAPFGASSFAARATVYLGQFVSPVAIALLVGAVLLATHLGPVLARLRLIALVATVTLGLSAIFGLVGLIGGLIGGATDFREKIEILLVHLPALALTVVALLFVLPKAIPAGPRVRAPRAENGFGHPQDPGYDYAQSSAQSPIPFQSPPQGHGAYPQAGGVPFQGQAPQQGVQYPQDQFPQGGHGFPQEAQPAQQAPYQRPALPPAPGSAGGTEGYGQQPPYPPQPGEGHSQASYPPAGYQPQQPGPQGYPQPDPLSQQWAEPQSPQQQPDPLSQQWAESQAQQPSQQPSQQPDPLSQQWAEPRQQPDPLGQQWAESQAQQPSQQSTGGYTPSPYVAADIQPPVPATSYDPPANAYDPPVYAAPVEPHSLTEPRLPNYPQQPDPQGFGRQNEAVYGQESQSATSGRHSSPNLPSYPQYPDAPAYGQPDPSYGRQEYGQPDPQGFGRQNEAVYGQESQPAVSGWQAESQPGQQRPEAQGFGQPEQQAPVSYPPVDGRQKTPFDGQPPQSFPQPPENYGQPFGGYPGTDVDRPAEQAPQYPVPDAGDLRSQQMAQAYQQAESYQQQVPGTEPQMRLPEYGSSGYGDPFGHPQTPPAPPAAPFQPQGGHQWDPRSEATQQFDPSVYRGDPLNDPGTQGRAWDSKPIDPTAIYKPEQRPGQATD